jgi:hypothetical protein
MSTFITDRRFLCGENPKYDISICYQIQWRIAREGQLVLYIHQNRSILNGGVIIIK